MGTFDYLSVLFSVILGLALTEILQGFRSLMLARQRVVLYWPALLWAVMIVIAVVQSWWGMFSMRTIPVWTFAQYGIVFLQVTLVYLVAGLTVPHVPAEGPVDMRAHYFDNYRWFFGLLALTIATTFVKDISVTGHISGHGNQYYLGFLLLLSVAAGFSKSRWLHAILAPLCLAIGVGYALLTSARI